MNELNRMAMARARQAEAEERADQRSEAERKQHQEQILAAETNRKAALLLHRLQQLGGPDAVIVIAIDLRSDPDGKGAEQAAWLIHRSNFDWSDVSEYYLLADGRFAHRNVYGGGEDLPRRCNIIGPRLYAPMLPSVERLLGQYS